MLERIEHHNGVVTYQSPLLRERGVPHAFSTRIGGVSAGPYATLNLGSLARGGEGDSNTSVAENFRRLRGAIGCDRRVRVETKQVHGAEVWTAPDKPVRSDAAPCADAIITDRPDKLLCIRTADCLPVLLSNKAGRMVGAVHAGWRGIVAGVIGEAVRAMHGKPGALTVALGPCIHEGRFEVGGDVIAGFQSAGLHGALFDHPDANGTKAMGSLIEAAYIQLLEAGVRYERIDRPAPSLCTYAGEDEFFSYRRDVTHRGGRTGHMAAVIGPCSRG